MPVAGPLTCVEPANGFPSIALTDNIYVQSLLTRGDIDRVEQQQATAFTYTMTHARLAVKTRRAAHSEKTFVTYQ